jgi:hypothetical protein
MLTVFDILQFAAIVAGVIVGYRVGADVGGIRSGVAGSVGGIVLGWTVGRLPLVLPMWLLGRSLRRASIGTKKRGPRKGVKRSSSVGRSAVRRRPFDPCCRAVKRIKAGDARSFIPCDAGRAAERSEAARPASHGTSRPWVTLHHVPSICVRGAFVASLDPWPWTKVEAA